MISTKMLPIRRALLQAQNLVRVISTDVTKFRRKGLGRDPGISVRREIMPTDFLDEPEFEEDFDDIESDFMNVSKSHKDHMRELELQKEKTKLHIVKQKYFKQKLPNFLTVHDKEQIKYLHRTNPKEWTMEQLADGFPATPDIIAKICKSTWIMKPHKIANHDAGVVKNWEHFKAGKMPELPRQLSEHLNKFTNRALNFKPFKTDTNKKVYENKPLVQGEFSKIITNYEKLKKNNEHQEILEEPATTKRIKIEKPPDSDTYLLSSAKKKSKPVTLTALREDLQQRQEAGEALEMDDKLLMDRLHDGHDSKQEEVVEIKQNIYEIIPKKDQKLKVIKTEPDQKHLEYPEKITIPSKLRSRNLSEERQRVYKLYDCYYDYDGMFLYRVPGME